MKKCIMVLGMHRSGTSAISGFLNKLGITLGSKLMMPNEYNEKGYFENSYIVNANNDILQTLGSSWDDLFLFEEEWWQHSQLIPHRDDVKKIINQEFSSNELFCIKDPRISILLPFWISILQELNIETFFIIPLRHPVEVAVSLKARDGFSIQKGLILWMNNMLSIEYYSRPFRRSFIVFDDFLKSPADTIHRILNKFNIVFPNTKLQIDTIAKELLDPKLKHHNIKALKFNNDMLLLIDQLNTILFNLNNNAEFAEDALIAIDKIRGEYKRLISIFYNQDIINTFSSFKVISADFNSQTQELHQTIGERNDQIAYRDAQIANLVAERTHIYNSTSWRITKPLRIVGHQLKRTRRVYELFMPAIRHGGGLKSTLKKAIQLYSHEGLAGIKRGFRIVATMGQTNPTLGSVKYDRNDYAEWIRRYDTPTSESLAIMKKRIDNFVRKPLISVVMPTYNPKQEWLIKAIESVRKQIYPFWELCIADDASTDKAIRAILERYAKEDPRIKIIFREKNGHISAASNSALGLATGEWIALLDHDDLLAEHALFWVVDAINQHPNARLIYSDEDKIDDSGRRFDPYFKCDWNLDLFYSHNMITHLGIYRTELLKEIGGFREGLEGAQDYDLALRCVERIEPEQIYHIPLVLYHWRVHADSTAKAGDAKHYALLAGKKALNEHLQRQGVEATAELLDFGMYRIRYALPDKLPLVSLIIPTRNKMQLLKRCVESILKKTTYPNYEILIVDNGSDDSATLQYFKQLQSDPRIRVVRDNRPFNFSALNNAAVKLARGEIVGLLNNDLEVISSEWLSEMVSHSLRPEVGAVGARLWYSEEILQHGGVVLGVGGVAGHAHKQLPRYQYGYFGRASLIQSFSAVSAACLVIRKSIYEEVGGFNEMDLQVAFNDINFCLHLREKGYRNIWTPYAELYHYESATRGYEDCPEKQMRFIREVQWMKKRWGYTLLNDPAYSPNLTLVHEDFSLAWPPRVELLALSPDQAQK